MNELFIQIQNNLNLHSLNKIDKDIFIDLKNNPHLIALNTSSNLAKKYYTNTTTINRFAKKAGFKSYTELRAIVNKVLEDQKIKPVLSKAALDTLEIDENMLFNFFNREYTYFIFGFGASKLSSKILQRKLLILGYPSIIIDDYHLVNKILRPKVIIISNSGEIFETLNMVEQLRKIRSIEIMSITKKNSTLAKRSDLVLEHNYPKPKNELESEQQIHIINVIDYVIDVLK